MLGLLLRLLGFPFLLLHLALGALLLLSGQLSGTLRDVRDLRDGIYIDGTGVGVHRRGISESLLGRMDEGIHVKGGVKR